MKKCTLFLLLFASLVSFSQKKIYGRVLDTENKPLMGASVYLNNTSIGTTTDDEGNFELSINEGTYDLIVSYIGYETIQYVLDSKSQTRKLVFKMLQKANTLDEVVIRKKKMSAEDRAYFIQRFKTTFIGRTNLAAECKIKNEKAILLDFDDATRTLEVSSKEPLEIIHKGLGYKIIYDLVHFQLTPTQVTFLGYSRYEELKGGKRKQRKWRKNRLRAYNGSMMHFVRSVIQNNFKKEGFVVNQYKKVPNPERPSDSLIRLARDYIRLTPFKVGESISISGMSKQAINIISDVQDQKAKNTQLLDTTEMTRERASFILRKARLKKFNDVLVKEDLTTEDFVIRTGSVFKIQFINELEVKYIKEKEEYAFRPGPNRLDYQASRMILLKKNAILDPSGTIIQPLDIFLDGYWGYEKVADTLPLDYQPKK